MKTKTIVTVILSVAFGLCLYACYWNCLCSFFAYTAPLEKYYNISKDDFIVIDEEDNHGGFPSDGSYYLILDCSENKEKAYEIISDWNELPLSENLQLIMYGGERNGICYGYNLSEEAKMPKVENGYYRFYDRHSESTDPSDDSDIFRRCSYNFSLAVYDSDTDIMYYFDFDT